MPQKRFGDERCEFGMVAFCLESVFTTAVNDLGNPCMLMLPYGQLSAHNPQPMQ
jgi:hypothetical protein